MFSSDHSDDEHGRFSHNQTPTAIVEAVDPVFLAARLVDADCPVDGVQLPELFADRLDGDCGNVVPIKLALVTLGLFSIVRLERKVQLLIPAYDFCIPDKECASSSNDPCDIFKSIKFPTNEFFPPRFCDVGDPNVPGCGCGKRED